jgi:hypothetical protein
LRGVQSLNSRPGERQYYRYYSAIDTSWQTVGLKTMKVPRSTSE